MDSDDLAAARQGYEQVLRLAPDFPDAARRLSYVELSLDDLESALRHAELAFRVDPSPYNEAALAQVLQAEMTEVIQENVRHLRQTLTP